MADSGRPSSYACKCLNVRIHPAPPPGTPQEPLDSSFTPVYVDEEGVRVVCTSILFFSRPRIELIPAGGFLPIFTSIDTHTTYIAKQGPFSTATEGGRDPGSPQRHIDLPYLPDNCLSRIANYFARCREWRGTCPADGGMGRERSTQERGWLDRSFQGCSGA